jgi:hypothetical protein
MARIETDPNYSVPTFSRATAATDLFKKEDVQALAAAISTHDHASGKGLAITRLAPGSVDAAAIPDGLITSAKIANGSILTEDIGVGGQIVVAYAVTGTTNNPQTTSTTFADMPDMSADITTIGGTVLFVWGVTAMNSSTVGGLMQMAISYDGTTIIASQTQSSAAQVGYGMALTSMAQIANTVAGGHQVRLRWNTGAGNTITALGTNRTMLIVEFKR